MSFTFFGWLDVEKNVILIDLRVYHLDGDRLVRVSDTVVLLLQKYAYRNRLRDLVFIANNSVIMQYEF